MVASPKYRALSLAPHAPGAQDQPREQIVSMSQASPAAEDRESVSSTVGALTLFQARGTLVPSELCQAWRFCCPGFPTASLKTGLDMQW